MLNMIRMELFRMFKSKSLYIIWIVMAVAIGFSTYMSVEELNTMTQEEKQQMYEEEQKSEVVFGLQVTAPTKPDAQVSVYDMFYANMKGKFIALFMVIFTVLYSTGDISSGYVKNIAGQVKDRRTLIYAKAAALCIYTICTVAAAVLIQAVCNQLFAGTVIWGDAKAFAAYAGVQTGLHFAFLLAVMCMAILIESNVFSVALGICICMNIMTIIYGFIDKMAEKAGFENFQMIKYTLTGRISMLGMEVSQKAVYAAISVTVVFAAAALLISSTVFKQRDI